MSSDTCKDKLIAIAKGLTAFQDTYAAATISFNATTHRISDTGNGLVFIVTDDLVTVAGSTSNDGEYHVTDGSHADYFVVAEDLVTEIAGDAVTITAPEHVTYGDYSVLEKGVGNSFVIIPGKVGDSVAEGGGSSIESWGFFGDLFVKFTNEKDTWAALSALRGLLLYRYRTYPKLNNTSGILKLKAICPDNVDGVFDKTGTAGPYWLTQRVEFAVNERTALSGGEIP